MPNIREKKPALKKAARNELLFHTCIFVAIQEIFQYAQHTFPARAIYYLSTRSIVWAMMPTRMPAAIPLNISTGK